MLAPHGHHVKHIRRLLNLEQKKISSFCLEWKSRLLATKMQANLTRHLVVFSDYEAKPCFSIDSHVKTITWGSMGSRALNFDFSS